MLMRKIFWRINWIDNVSYELSAKLFARVDDDATRICTGLLVNEC